MKVLADENIERATIDWLRQTGHEVTWVAELSPAQSDASVLELALKSSSILLTRDLDFGELVYREGRAAAGIILVRIHAVNQQERLSVFQEFWPQIAPQAPGRFIVVSNHQVRVRNLHL